MTSRWRDLPASTKRSYAVTVALVVVAAGSGLGAGWVAVCR